ncbi:Dabb family protein [Actinoplanes sp. URMC 104]|uniref:Dabb family protein n=1 Tax=Actinoplanes sp. URMC 104 TaxID=3423409 RepID=UPI003F1E31AB
MITHVVLFRWTGEPEKQSRHLAEALPQMMREVGGIAGYEFGSDLGRLGDGYHAALLVRLQDEDALRRYEQHPAHHRVIDERVNPALDGLAIVQFAS